MLGISRCMHIATVLGWSVVASSMCCAGRLSLLKRYTSNAATKMSLSSHRSCQFAKSTQMHGARFSDASSLPRLVPLWKLSVVCDHHVDCIVIALDSKTHLSVSYPSASHNLTKTQVALSWKYE
jgi:hypothetical protein